MSILSVDEASSRLRADHDVLLAAVSDLAAEQLAAAFQLASGPLGDFCESLHDLVAHVLMWDEINLAVLTEAAAGRAHWSLEPRWETPEAGRLLNRSGVQAGRQLPASLLMHRLRTVHSAVLGQHAFWHAAIHLNQLPLAARQAGRKAVPGHENPHRHRTALRGRDNGVADAAGSRRTDQRQQHAARRPRRAGGPRPGGPLCSGRAHRGS